MRRRTRLHPHLRFGVAGGALCLVSCGGASEPVAAPQSAAASDSDPAPAPVADTPAAPVPLMTHTGEAITGDGIEAWFVERGAKLPGALDPAQTQCHAVSAPVPSGQALWCEQGSSIKPWVAMTRTVMYDVRDGRRLLLVNLLSRVSGGEAEPGQGCDNAIIALRIFLAEDGRSLTVGEDSQCPCGAKGDDLAAEAKRLGEAGKAKDAKTFKHQADQVKAACAQLGAYEWDDSGFVRAK